MSDFHFFFREAANTLKASRWTLFKARWLGVKHVGVDGAHSVTIYHYRGVSYLFDFKEKP
jgi:hypothetical protein